MKPFRLMIGAALIGALGACAPQPDLAARQQPDAAGGIAPAGAAILLADYAVRGVAVSVPDTLTVSEENLYYPVADVVWRGEPRGDRRAQVAAIFRDAAGTATAAMTRGRPVTVDLDVVRFHSLTEKARYTVGGVHSIRFDITVRDAATGAVIDGPRRIRADLRAAGGQKALDEDSSGRTQRVVVVAHLADTMRRELAHRAVPPAGVPLARLDPQQPAAAAIAP
jgi:hypothetical protein